MRSKVPNVLQVQSTLSTLCILPIPDEAEFYMFHDVAQGVPVTKMLCSASACSICGNSVVGGSETCDDGGLRFITNTMRRNVSLSLSAETRGLVASIV